MGNQNNNRQINIHIFSFHHVAKHIKRVFFCEPRQNFAFKWGPQHFKKQEFLALIRYTLLLDEVSSVRLHDVTKEFLMDFYYLG